MKIVIKHTVTPEEAGCDAASLLAKLSELPKQRVKDAMTKGAVILKRKQGKRLRRAKETLLVGDQIALCYDDNLLSLSPPEGSYSIKRLKTYSVWYKPAGLMSQGTAFGDHLALQRLVEQAFNCPVFLVHRLDRETSGIMLFAHTKATAAQLSRMFEQHQIEKIYHTSVLGQTDEKGTITEPLDSKTAITHYERISYDPVSNQSQLRIRLETGRLHQIRRHLVTIDHPVIGDPRYGSGNKNRDGLQLVAKELSFECPDTRHQVRYKI